MSDGFLGMDPEQMQDLIDTVKSEGDRITTLRGELERKVREVTWEGPDAEQFKGDDWNKISTKLQTVIDRLETMRTNASRNLQEQQEASQRYTSAF